MGPAGAADRAARDDCAGQPFGAPPRAPRHSSPAPAPAAAAARHANATGAPKPPRIQAGGTAIRLPRPGHQRLLALSLLCVAWRQALSGAASAMIRHQPPACAVIGHRHRHRRPRFALRAAGHRRGRTNGRLSALPISPSCQPFLQPTMGCRPPKAHRGAVCGHSAPRGAVCHHRYGKVRGRRHRRPGCACQDAPIAVADFALCRMASGALWCRRCACPTSTCRLRGHQASPRSMWSSYCPSRAAGHRRGRTDGCFSALPISLSCPLRQHAAHVHHGAAMKLCVLLDRTMELTGPLIVDHPLAALVIFASESYNPSLIVNHLCDHTSLALRAPCAWADL